MTYVLHILNIRLWEYEAVRDKAEMEMLKHGPDQYNTEAQITATSRISEIKTAIDKLSSQC
jgi:hypothetical protein